MEKRYKYLGYVMIILIPLIFAGFYKTYFEHFPNFTEKIHWFDHVHAFVAAIWVLMLIVQPVLILRKKYSAHRKIGKLSYVIFPLFILSFVPQIIKVIKTEDIKNLFFPLADASLLISFYLLAIYNRKNVVKHMRYMIAGALVLLGPTVGRIGPILLGLPDLVTQNIQYAIIYAILIGLLLYDAKSLKKNQPYLVAIGLFLVHQMTFYFLFT